MFSTRRLSAAALILAAAITASPASAQTNLGTSFTYQGDLKVNGSKLNGTADFFFTLYDAATGGNQVGITHQVFGLNVVDGQVTTPVDFGTNIENSARWMEIAVRSPSNIGNFTTLPGRQPIRVAPVAGFSQRPWSFNGSRTALDSRFGNVGIGTLTPNANFMVQSIGGSGVWKGGIAAGGTTAATVFGELNGVATLGGHNGALAAWGPLAINPTGSYVGIGTTTPAAPLHVYSNSPYVTSIIDSANTAGTWLDITNSSVGGRDWQLISSGSGNGGGAGNLLIATGTVPTSTDIVAMTLTPTGRVGVGTLAPTAPLHVAIGTDVSLTGGGFIVSGSPTGLNVAMDDNEIIARNNGAASPLYLNQGSGDVIVPVLQITGGSDVAEPYDVSGTGDTEPQPGMVVAIDPNNVGKMRVISMAYDHAVAGIISGANGIKPGLTLTQTGTVADGALPVASIGRVWCWCDADASGPISAGDMLTTSDTPGHAMKVVDHDKAQGAVLGKAMSSLKSGKGLVLVLVSLQ